MMVPLETNPSRFDRLRCVHKSDQTWSGLKNTKRTKGTSASFGRNVVIESSHEESGRYRSHRRYGVPKAAFHGMGPTRYAWLYFGQLWYAKYSLRIDCRSQHIEVESHTKFESVDGCSFQEKLNSGPYEEIYQLKVTNGEPAETLQELKPVIDEYKDVFPEQLRAKCLQSD